MVFCVAGLILFTLNRKRQFVPSNNSISPLFRHVLAHRSLDHALFLTLLCQTPGRVMKAEGVVRDITVSQFTLGVYATIVYLWRRWRRI